MQRALLILLQSNSCLLYYPNAAISFHAHNRKRQNIRMNMFAKTSGGVRNQTTDLRQIVQQSEQTGKDSLLKDMLRGVQKKTERRYRLLVRYLSDFL